MGEQSDMGRLNQLFREKLHDAENLLHQAMDRLDMRQDEHIDKRVRAMCYSAVTSIRYALVRIAQATIMSIDVMSEEEITGGKP